MKARPAWLHLLPAALLLPFLNKAFHIDDPLFLYLARVFRASPLEPFKTPVLWDSWFLTPGEWAHPLLWPYLLAGVVSLFGESEVVLHLLTFSFALLALGGLGMLAKELGVSRLPPCLFLAGSSVYLAMGSTVMPDVPMCGLAVMSVALLVRGARRDSVADRVLSGALAGAAFLCRYNAFILLGLLLLDPLLRRERRPRAFLAFGCGMTAIVVWELLTWRIGGHPHFLGTLGRWTVPLSRTGLASSAFSLLVQLGGQLPLLWLPVGAALLGRRRLHGAVLASGGLLIAGALAALRPGAVPLDAFLFFVWPAAVFVLAAGLQLAGALRDSIAGPADPGAVLRGLLSAWALAGTFATVTYVHVAAKYILLALPAACLLVVDGLTRLDGTRSAVARAWLALSAAATLTVGLLVALSDYRWADTYRTFMAENGERIRAPHGHSYVNGDWGFRYYAERAGFEPYHGQPLGFDDRLLRSSLVVQTWTANEPEQVVVEQDLVRYPGPFAITNVMHSAGFHSSNLGPYPYRLASDVVERIWLFRGP